MTTPPRKTAGWVLLHGFTGSPAAWDEVRAALARRGTVLCPVLVGHAPDTGPASDFIAEVDRLAQHITAAGNGPWHLCGYSLGARVALGLLARHRALFARATLIGVHPGLPTDAAERAERAASDERWASIAEREGAAAFAAQWAGQPLFATQGALPDAVRRRQDAIRNGHDGKALAAAMRALSLARMPDWAPHLAQVELPVELLVGARDTKFVRLAHTLAARMPCAHVATVPDVGHNVLLERPSAIIAALSN
jgi:2-succinyl-6-hydroxy-2,4-cyclohexadiene-1-carboxylate synthase